MTTPQATIMHGTPPDGTATGEERWITVQVDDNRVIVRAYRGWGVTDEATFTGPTATGMADTFAEVLFDVLP